MSLDAHDDPRPAPPELSSGEPPDAFDPPALFDLRQLFAAPLLDEPSLPSQPLPGDRVTPPAPPQPPVISPPPAAAAPLPAAPDASSGDADAQRPPLCDPAALFEPRHLLDRSPNFLYRLLEPSWAEANQLIHIDYDLGAIFASALGESVDYVGDTKEFGEKLADRTSNEPGRIKRLKKIIHDAIAGPPDGEGRPLLDQVIADNLHREVSMRPTRETVDRIYAHAYGWGPLESFMRDSSVTEIMVVRHNLVFTERTIPGEGARLIRETVRFETPDVLRRFVARMAEGAKQDLDQTRPTLDLSLPSGERVNITIYPVTDGPTLTIRRPRKESIYTLAELQRLGSFSAEMLEYLHEANLAGANLLTFGETGSGKTTLLTALINDKPAERRIVIVEDTREISLDDRHENRIPMLKAANRDMRDLVRNALRQRPDHLIVGETRDATAYDLVQAFSTGTRGSMSTIHASSPIGALRRLTTLLRQEKAAPDEEPARASVADAIHLLVHAGRLSDGNRALLSIDEVGPLTEKGEFTVVNVFHLVSRPGEDGRAIKEFVHNPDYEMTEVLAEMFRGVGLDPARWTGRQRRGQQVAAEGH